jgi:hypothetical protein
MTKVIVYQKREVEMKRIEDEYSSARAPLYFGELTRRGISESSAGDPRCNTTVKDLTKPAVMAEQ